MIGGKRCPEQPSRVAVLEVIQLEGPDKQAWTEGRLNLRGGEWGSGTGSTEPIRLGGDWISVGTALKSCADRTVPLDARPRRTSWLRLGIPARFWARGVRSGANLDGTSKGLLRR